MSINGKYALITGGASGIGLEIAKLFSQNGAYVWVCDIDEARLENLNQDEQPIQGFAADVGSEGDVQRVFEKVLHHSHGRLDILVNNAGIAGPNGPLEELQLNEWESTLRTNLVSTFLCCREALPVMKSQRSGAIVNLSSTAGTHGYPLRTPYASAKWGIIGLTKSLAMEVGIDGIRVNAICPGAVSGPRMDRVIAAEAKTRGIAEDAVRREIVSQTSLGCFVDASDIAQMALFVCSDNGARISGQALSVDGNTETLAQIKD